MTSSRFTADKLRRLDSRATGQIDEAWRPYLALGIVTATGGSGTFTVATLKEDGTSSGVTFGPCVTAPAGGTASVDDKVVLWFARKGEPPYIIQTGSAATGVGDPKGVVTVDNEDGTYDVDVLDWDDEETVVSSVEDVRPWPPRKLFVGDYVWLKFDPDGTGAQGLLA